MNKKTFTLISTLTGCAGTAASAIVTYMQPEMATAIVAGIGIAVTAAIEIMNLFVKE